MASCRRIVSSRILCPATRGVGLCEARRFAYRGPASRAHAGSRRERRRDHGGGHTHSAHPIPGHAPRRPAHLFHDVARGACILCNEPLEHGYQLHTSNAGHVARYTIYDLAVRLIDCYKKQLLAHTPSSSSSQATPAVFVDGVPSLTRLRAQPDLLAEVDVVDVLVRKWWAALQPARSSGLPDFSRVCSLSARGAAGRRRRLRHLLVFFKERGVLRDSVFLPGCKNARVVSNAASLGKSPSISRTDRFEHFETIGDAVIRSLFEHRLACISARSEVPVQDNFVSVQQLLESNRSMQTIFDYLALSTVLGVYLPDSKIKADVVESIVGELHTFLLATGSSTPQVELAGPLSRTVHCLRALVAHFLNELAHSLVMWCLEETVRNVRPMLEDTAGLGELVSVLTHRHAADVAPRSSALLPCMAAFQRPAPAVREMSACEALYYATHHAPTRASPEHEVRRALCATPRARVQTPDVMRAGRVFFELDEMSPWDRTLPEGKTATQRCGARAIGYVNSASVDVEGDGAASCDPDMPDFFATPRARLL